MPAVPLQGLMSNGQTNKRGILVDNHLRMADAPSVFAVGDCTSISYAPTAQVASQQGAYLAHVLGLMVKRDAPQDQINTLSSAEQLDDHTTKRIEKLKKKIGRIRLNPFEYSHQGSLAYIGSEGHHRFAYIRPRMDERRRRYVLVLAKRLPKQPLLFTNPDIGCQ